MPVFCRSSSTTLSDHKLLADSLISQATRYALYFVLFGVLLVTYHVQAFISTSVQASSAYNEKTEQIRAALGHLLDDLNKHSIPFYSPRYSAHMCVDQSMPAILGYLSTMFFNPNNVAFEASPYTTALELKVGKQMSAMMGYNILEEKVIEGEPLSWGHITCDGTVANLEAVWYVL